jgi:sarcosine oxidase delta subunit
VRDLRTLREAAMILGSNQHTAECQRIVAVVRDLVTDPARAIETSSDTDEDKAEVLDEMRRRKTAALKNAAQ